MKTLSQEHSSTFREVPPVSGLVFFFPFLLPIDPALSLSFTSLDTIELHPDVLFFFFAIACGSFWNGAGLYSVPFLFLANLPFLSFHEKISPEIQKGLVPFSDPVRRHDVAVTPDSIPE